MTENSTVLVTEEPIRRTLVIGSDEVRFLGGENEARQKVRGLDHSLDTYIWKLRRARERSSPKLNQTLLETGMALSECFLVGAIAEALADAVADAEVRGVPLELGVRVEDSNLAAIPWETLRLPDSDETWGLALSLHPNVHFYRSVKPRRDQVVHIKIPGPLRILVAIGSPEAQNRRGELLDYEAELERILDAVDAARRKAEAHVRILHWGTVNAIYQALEEERYHVLYISCHAAPGVLILEDENGRKDLVDSKRLVEHLPVGRRPPLVVLAGCATALGREAGALPQANPRAGDYLPGLAEALLARGVPCVLAMQARVGDVYARRLGAMLFGSLATFEQKEPLRALTSARQTLERKRCEEPDKRDRAEWATPALYLPELAPGERTSPVLVSDAYGPKEELKEVSEAIFPDGVVHRRKGFVGRRREERLARKALLDHHRAGVLFHGLGGVGKSTLAAELLARLREDHLILSIYQKASTDLWLDAIGTQLFQFAMSSGLPEDDPLRKVSNFLRRSDESWEDRFDLLANKVLPNRSLLVLVDNFEDYLVECGKAWEVEDSHLAELLTRWVRRPGRSRILITSRHPFQLPKSAEKRLQRFHLGPLSYAETRKLFWRLPQLDALNLRQQMQAYAVVGGHPRTLEYLDALLSGGRARFQDVAEKLRDELQKDGHDPEQWLADTKGDLDKALAQVVTVAVQDVVLNDLVKGLDDPLARTLLFRASVYRSPVDFHGLAWQVGREYEAEAAPDPSAQPRTIDEITRWIQQHGTESPPDDFRLSGYEHRIDNDLEVLLSASAEDASEDFSQAVDRLLALGLLAPAGEGQFIVHRWTAEALTRLDKAGDIREGHRRAARYWRWRVDTQPEDRMKAVEQRLEARWHHQKAQESDEAILVTINVAIQLYTWGAYQWEAQICREELDRVPERSLKAAAFLHELGNIAHSQGRYDEALSSYRKSLEICEELGNRSVMATSCHQLGSVAQERGAYDEALAWYQQSLELKEELGDRLGMANSYHRLGTMCQDRGSYDEARNWFQKSMQISQEVGDRLGLACSYHQLGMISHIHGTYDEALDNYRKALEIAEELGDRPKVATSYHQLGMLADECGLYDEALEWHRKALVIEEEIGNWSGMAGSYHQLGMVAENRGAYPEALSWYQRSLEIDEEIGNLSGIAGSLHQIGTVAVLTGKPEEGVPWHLRALSILMQIGSPEAPKPLRQLIKEEDLLDQDRFREILDEHLDEENRDAVLGLMEQYRQARQEAEAEADGAEGAG